MKKMKWVVAGAGSCLIAFAAVLALGAGSPPAPVEETIALGGLTVTVWAQAEPAESPQPVVIFSHGFHGCSTQSRFLMNALASDGYLVFAPNHADATCNGGTAKWTDPPQLPFADPKAWSDSTFEDREQDIHNLIAAIAADSRFASLADLSRLALAGHSLGGYTVLGLSGAWPSWDLPESKAVLALSPYDQPFLVHDTLGGLAAPVMYQGGTLDLGITPSVKKPDGAYDSSPAPKYFMELYAAGHLAWSDAGPVYVRPDIVAYSLAFLDHYVKGKAALPLLTQPRTGVALLRYDSELGNNGKGQKGGR